MALVMGWASWPGDLARWQIAMHEGFEKGSLSMQSGAPRLTHAGDPGKKRH